MVLVVVAARILTALVAIFSDLSNIDFFLLMSNNVLGVCGCGGSMLWHCCCCCDAAVASAGALAAVAAAPARGHSGCTQMLGEGGGAFVDQARDSASQQFNKSASPRKSGSGV